MTTDAKPPEDDSDATEMELIGKGARALGDEKAPPRRPPAGALIILPAAPAAGGAAFGKIRMLLTASVTLGLALGYVSGSRTGVRPALEAGGRVDAASLARALPWKNEIAAEAVDRRQVARLLDDLRSLRAQVEQMRHASETSRILDRIHALEVAGRAAPPAPSRSKVDPTARLVKLEERFARLERAGADRTATGSIAKPETAKPDNAKAEDAEAAAKAKAAKALRARFVLREVSGGVAMIERSDGLIEEVAPGDDLPGAGRVTAIERRGRDWVVFTTRGVIDRRAD